MNATGSVGGFQLTEIPASTARQPGDLLQRLFDGQQLGAILRGVFDPTLLAAIVAQLQHPSPRLQRSRVEHYRGWQLGRTLVIEPGSLDAYFAESAVLREACAELFAPCGGYERALQDTLRPLARGAAITPAKGTDGRVYGPSTIRILGDGAAIDLHCEDETRRFPAMRDLEQSIDLSSQLSFYVPLSLPEAGGQLRIYNARHGASEHQLELRDRQSAQTLALVDSLEFVVADVRVGDLLIFDAGRYFHRVTPVQGHKERWTMGGFLARSRDHSAVHYWA